MSDTTDKPKPKDQTRSTADIPAQIVLYDDEWHTFEEVIEQIMMATGYRSARAEMLTWEVHTRGKSTIYSGELSKCLYISGILEEINLGTEVQY